jgi:hypothetical protein
MAGKPNFLCSDRTHPPYHHRRIPGRGQNQKMSIQTRLKTTAMGLKTHREGRLGCHGLQSLERTEPTAQDP